MGRKQTRTRESVFFLQNYIPTRVPTHVPIRPVPTALRVILTSGRVGAGFRPLE
jgi:hypothetical protein